jgi:CHAT domain-containing protein
MLQGSGQTLLSSDYQSGRLHYLTELAAVQRSTGRNDEALANAWAAVHQSEHILSALHSTAEKELWSRESSTPYGELVKVYLQRGQKTDALQAWERYRRAPYTTAPDNYTSYFNELRTTRLSNDRILVLARVDENYVGWLLATHPLRVLRTATLGDRAHLQQSATTFYHLCADRDSSLGDVRAVGGRLYAALLKPFADQLSQTNRLLVEVDPTLAMLPFAALTTPDGAWLGTSSPITILPAWWTLHPDSAIEDTPLLASLHLVVVSGFGSEGSTEQQNTISEASEVAHLFPNATLVAGSSANPQTVLHNLISADIFHFSGHATNALSPQLLLSSEDAEHPVGLNAASLVSVHLLHCKVAVLAACNTTAADPDQIEKLPDIRNALLFSGAHSVVASNWDVDDHSTRSLMLAFYRYLLSGFSPARALQSAQQSLLAGSDWRHPYYWASFEIFTN